MWVVPGRAPLWLLVVLVLVAGYQYRYELQDVASRVTAGTTIPTVGEVSLTAAYEAEEFVFLRYGRAG